VRAIVGQQLSVLAARAIYGRLTARFGGRPPTPAEILADDPEELRAAAGLSRAKVSFLRSLAEHASSGELELDGLGGLDDEHVIAELTAVKGIGRWSADMFLMFHLERPDVLPVGDLGIRRAFERAYALPGLPDAAEMERIAEPWRPHRTLACRYLWRSLQNEPG
jgi:DNA-3-methyladenine glycosylase II